MAVDPTLASANKARLQETTAGLLGRWPNSVNREFI